MNEKKWKLVVVDLVTGVQQQVLSGVSRDQAMQAKQQYERNLLWPSARLLVRR